MRGSHLTSTVVRATAGLAILLLSSSQLSAYKALSEDELERTVASGVQPASSVPQDDVHDDRTTVSKTTDQNADNTAVEESAKLVTDTEFSLVAYRGALPIVMNRMTATNNGPLGANGNYSLPLGSRDQLPVSPGLLKLSPPPYRSIFHPLFGHR